MNHQLENYVNKLSIELVHGPEINVIKDKIVWNQ